jgi:hypothetical protein
MAKHKFDAAYCSLSFKAEHISSSKTRPTIKNLSVFYLERALSCANVISEVNYYNYLSPTQRRFLDGLKTIVGAGRRTGGDPIVEYGNG